MKYLVKILKGKKKGLLKILGEKETSSLQDKGEVEIIKIVQEKPNMVIK